VNKTIDNIIGSLKFLGLEILTHEKIMDDYVIKTDLLLLNYKIETNSLYLSFHTSVRSDISASYALFLKERMTELNKVFIMESYCIDKNEKILSGKEAYELYASKKESMIFKNAVQDILQKEFLTNVKGFNC